MSKIELFFHNLLFNHTSSSFFNVYDSNMDCNNYIRDGRAPIPEDDSTSRIMSSIRGRNTKPELIIRKELWNKGIRGYRLHWKKVPGTPDISFPGKKIAIFINGCFWHRCPICNPMYPKSHKEFWKEKFRKNMERDKRKIDLLTADNWKALVIWECEIKNNLIKCINEVEKIITT